MTDAGRIMVIPKGKYNASITYEKLDAVTYNGKGFIALKTVSGVTPTDDGTNWRLYVDNDYNADIDASNLAPTFTVASTRENINSGEKMSTLFGKVKKYFTDIKGHAYKDLVTNATTTTAGSPLDATVAKTLNDSIGTIKNQIGGHTVNSDVPANAKFTDTTYEIATTSRVGIVKPDGTTITADEDGTLHGVAEVTVDTAMSDTSTNPVQNKVIKAYVDKEVSENVDFSTSTSKTLHDSIEAPLVLSNATRNLLNPTLQTTTQNGVTCTNNGDGTYTLNGTASSECIFWIQNDIFIKKGTYKFVGTPNIGGISIGGSLCNYAPYEGGVITFDNDVTGTVAIVIENGVKCVNAVSKPMITTDLSATYDDFVPYGGYDIKTCGKNLLNLVKITYVNLKGATASLSNGIITLNGTVDTSDGWKDLYFDSVEQYVSLKKGVKYTISTKDKVQKVFIILREYNSLKMLYSHDCSTNGTTFVASQDVYCKVTVTFKETSTFNDTQIVPQIEVGENVTEYQHYQDGGTVHIDSTTKFPLLGLKSFNGITNIISPGNVEVTYAKSDSGAAILDMSENKLDKGNVVNNQTTTEEGFALDARQANPNIDGTLAKQVADLNGSLNYVAPKGESALRSLDGIVSLSIYNDSLNITYNKDVSKDYYAQLTISTSGMVLKANDSSGYHTKQIVNLNDFTDISSNDDLNDIKFFNVGKYRCPYNSVAVTLLNSPFNTAFTMEVFQSAGISQYIAQKAIEFESGHCKWRMRDMKTDTIVQDWVQLY